MFQGLRDVDPSWGLRGTDLSQGLRRHVSVLGSEGDTLKGPGGIADSALILKGSDGSLAWGHGLNLSPSDTAEEDEDLYDCVENEEAEGDEIYEDLMRSETVPTPVCGSGKGWAGGEVGRVEERVTSLCGPCSQPKMTEYDKRCCCLREIQQTEEKYTDTLGSIHQVRYAHGPCQGCLLPASS